VTRAEIIPVNASLPHQYVSLLKSFITLCDRGKGLNRNIAMG
jgi:hypothetical protein